MMGAVRVARNPVHAAFEKQAATMHVVASVGDERFAFRVADVEEAIDAPEMLTVPNAPPGLMGQFAHRGRTVSAFDAAWMFGVEREGGGGTALVLRVASDRLGLLVDDVEDLTALDESAVRPAPSGTDPSGLLSGVCLPRAEAWGERRGARVDRRKAKGESPRFERRQGERRATLICVVNVVAVVARASHATVEGVR